MRKTSHYELLWIQTTQDLEYRDQGYKVALPNNVTHFFKGETLNTTLVTYTNYFSLLTTN